MEYIMISIATVFNFIIIRWKINNGRYFDAFADASLLAILSYIFSTSLGGMVIAMYSSAFISIYLIFDPIELFTGSLQDFKEKYKGIAKRLTKILLVTFILVAIIYALISFKII